MKRLWRIFFKALTVLSLLLCLVTVILWVRSSRTLDHVLWIHGHSSIEAFSPRGRIVAIVTPRDHFVSPSYAFLWTRDSALDVPSPGFYFSKSWDGWWRFTVMFPCWIAVLTFAMLPLYVVLRSLICKRRGAMNGRCLVCGYDLRATPNRCPECGMVPHKAKA
jgi:hypothetical protein